MAKFMPVFSLMIGIAVQHGRDEDAATAAATAAKLKEDIRADVKAGIKEGVEEVKGKIKDEVKEEMKEEFKNELESIKQDALIEVNKAIDSNVMLQKKITEKMVKCKNL